MVRRTPRSGKSKKDTSAEINEDSFEKTKKGKQTSSKGSGPKPRRSAEVSISPIKSPAAEKDEELIESEAPDENEADSPKRDGGPSKEDLLSSLALSDKKKLKAKEDEEKRLPKIRSSKRTRMPNVRLEDQEKSEDSNNKKKSVKKDGSNSAGKDKSNPSVKKTELSVSPKPAYISDFDDGAGEELVKNKSKEQPSKDESLNEKNNHDREDATPKLKKRKGKETKKQSKTKGDNSVEVQDTSVNDSNSVNTSRGKLKGIVDKEKEEDSLDESFDATTLPTSTPLPSRGRGRGRGRPRGSRGRGRGRGRGAYQREKGDDENNSYRHSISVDGDSSISLRTSSRKRKAKKYCDEIGLGSDSASDSDGSDDDDDEEDSKKKKTKRRKVNVSDEDTTSEVSTVGRKPKGRGKKRSLDESCELEYAPVAKRGRPRKTPTIQIKSPEIVASTLCMRCDKDLITLAGLKFHLMTEHQALWAKDCPEGKTDIAALKRIMKAQGKLVCQKCRKELRHYHYYVHHIQWCGREEERTVCEVCGRSQKSMWYHAHLVYHKKRDNDEEKFKVQEEKEQKEKEEGGEDLNKLGKKKRKSAKKAMQTLAEIGADEKKTSRSGRRKGDSEDDYSGAEDSDVDKDFQGSGDEEEEDDDDADHEIEDNEGVTTKDKVKMKKSYRSYTTNSPYFSDHPDFFLEILAAKEQEDNNVLFPKLIPRNNNWKELPTEEAKSYMTDRKSHPFVVKRGNDKNDAKQLRISECITSTGHSTCYTGYSVWGLAWCPVPFKKTANQIAAVSCNLTSDHATNKTFSEPAVVQIWDFGELTCNNSSTPDPKLAFSIGHDYGSVWQVCWCPKGVWEEPVVTLDNTKEDLPRLGLLALGCSDGTVRIFSIPHPQFLAATSDVYFPTEEQIQRERTPPVYKAQPCLTLTSRPNSDTGSCLCVDWQKAGGSQYILAGYSQGCVQVYDLITTSPLLRVLSNTVESIFPSRAFPAHLRAVTGCSWSETVPSCFSTAGRDKVVMFWDMNNPNRPYDKWLSSDMGMLTSIKWASRVYNGVVTAQDDCLHLAHNTSYYQETGFSGLHGFFDKALCVHNSVVWDVTYSPHFNVLLSCDGSGCVVAVKTVDLRIPSSKFTKGTPRSKAILYTTQITSPSTEEKSEAESPSKESDQPCIEFSDSEHMSHIRALNSKDDTGYKMPSISVGAIDAAPLQSVYRISVNPNLESCTWILSGGEAGFLRLHNLCGMLTSTAKTELGIS